MAKEAQSYADKLKAGLETTEGREAACTEIADQEARKENVILRGLEESNKEEGADRKAEDVERVVGLFQAMGIHANESIKAARRLGTRDPDKRYRPLLLRVSEELREKLLHYKEKLRQVNTREGTRYRTAKNFFKKRSQE